MGIGIGIFLGLATLGIIYLYTQTKDRWNWVKLAKRFGIGIAIIIAIPFVLMGGAFVYDSANNYLNDRPKLVNGIDGITIGDKFSEVEFKNDIKENEKDSVKSAKAYQINDNEHIQFFVANKTNAVDRIIYLCKDKNYKIINGISCADTSEKIIDKFGKKNIEVYCSTKEKTKNTDINPNQLRLYVVRQYGMAYALLTNSVRGFIVDEDWDLSDSDIWTTCNKAQD